MIRWGCRLSQIGSREFCAPLLVSVGFLLFIAFLPSVSSALDPPERRARGATPTVQPVQQLAPGQRALPMWEVTRFDHPDSVLYVIAELGYGRQPVTELPSAIERVFDSADTLIVSVDDLRPGFAERVASAVDRNRWLRRKKLPDLLDESTHAGLRSLLVGAGQEGDYLDSFRPWYAQGWVEWTFYEGRGFDEQYSLHRALLARARGLKKIVEIEDLAERYARVGELGDQTSVALLRFTIENRKRLSRMPVVFEEAVTSGDLSAAEDLVARLRRRESAFDRSWEQLVDGLAARYAERLFVLSDSPGAQLALLPVGAMLGPDGVPARLARRGLDVRRVAVEARTRSPERRMVLPSTDPVIGAPTQAGDDPGHSNPLEVRRGRDARLQNRASLVAEDSNAHVAARVSSSSHTDTLEFRRFAPVGSDGIFPDAISALGCPPCVVVSMDHPEWGSAVAQETPVFVLDRSDVSEALLLDEVAPASLESNRFALILVIAEHARPRIASHAIDSNGAEAVEEGVEFLAASLSGQTRAYTALIHSRGISLSLPTRKEALAVAARLGLSPSSRSSGAIPARAAGR